MISQVVLIVLALITFASFVWSFKKFFRRGGGKDFRLAAVQWFGLAAMLGQLWSLYSTDDYTPWQVALGVLCYSLSLSIFWSAIRAHRISPLIAFSKEGPQAFLNRGPYRFIRHPFYSSYMLAWTAGLVATLQWWLLIPSLVLGVCYVQAALHEEKQFLESSYAEEYRAYQKVTGMFFPGV